MYVNDPLPVHVVYDNVSGVYIRPCGCTDAQLASLLVYSTMYTVFDNFTLLTAHSLILIDIAVDNLTSYNV